MTNSYSFDAADNRIQKQSALTADTTPPSAPGAVSLSGLATTSVTASWGAASDNVGVTGYQFSLNSGASWTSVGLATSVNVTGLAAGTAYTFMVRATDAAGNLGPSASKSFTTQGTSPPSAPGVPVATNVVGTSATMSWAAATDTVGVTGYSYNLNGGAWVSIGNVLSVNVTGLAGSTTAYTFSVRAQNAAGIQGPSTAVSFQALYQLTDGSGTALTSLYTATTFTPPVGSGGSFWVTQTYGGKVQVIVDSKSGSGSCLWVSTTLTSGYSTSCLATYASYAVYGH
jgi:chitodextrinase